MAFSQQPSNQQHRQQAPPQLNRETSGNMDSRIPTPVTFFNRSTLHDQTNHSTYISPFQGMGMGMGLGLEPAPVEQVGGDGGLNLQWNYGFEHTKEVQKDCFKSRPVSTGLGLSLDNNQSDGLLVSLRNSFLPALIADEIYGELEKQDEEISRYMTIQNEQFRKTILEKFQASQIRTLSYIDGKLQQKLHEKEAEADDLKRKNEELKALMVKVAMERAAWEQMAQSNETMIKSLRFKLDQAFAHMNDNNKEGCGDSELDDSASCYNGRPNDFHLFPKDVTGMKEMMSCKVCKFKKVCILSLPCKHLCLCKECDSKLSTCPMCDAPKYVGLEVYM